jgi:hypothetical protein
MMGEIKNVVDDLLDNARVDYQVRQGALKDLEELNRMLDDPLLVNNKEMAAWICHILIIILIGEGVMKEDSIIHRLGLRLLDYIGRVYDEGPKKFC